MSRVLKAFVAAAGAGVFVAGGCTSYSEPKLSLSRVESVEETPRGLVLRVHLLAENENEVALPLRDVDYTAQVGEGPGALTFRGRRSPESTLRRKGTQEIVLPVALRLGEGGAGRPVGVVPFTLTAEITYVTPGALAEVLFDNDVRRPVATVSTSGMVDMGSGPQAPASLVKTGSPTPGP
jgi:hypothetical protein